jgi:hypothetical protein
MRRVPLPLVGPRCRAAIRCSAPVFDPEFHSGAFRGLRRGRLVRAGVAAPLFQFPGTGKSGALCLHRCFRSDAVFG